MEIESAEKGKSGSGHVASRKGSTPSSSAPHSQVRHMTDVLSVGWPVGSEAGLGWVWCAMQVGVIGLFYFVSVCSDMQPGGSRRSSESTDKRDQYSKLSSLSVYCL